MFNLSEERLFCAWTKKRKDYRFLDSLLMFKLDAFFEYVNHIQSFPRQIQICSTEVTVSCYLFVDRSQQVEVFDDRCRTQVEVCIYDFCDFVIRNFTCAECVYQYGNGFCNTDGISNLYFTFCSDTGTYDVFRNVS